VGYVNISGISVQNSSFGSFVHVDYGADISDLRVGSLEVEKCFITAVNGSIVISNAQVDGLLAQCKFRKSGIQIPIFFSATKFLL
jgi:hypothetical protein